MRPQEIFVFSSNYTKKAFVKNPFLTAALKNITLAFYKHYVSSLASSLTLVKVMCIKFPNKQKGQKKNSNAQCSLKI